MATNEEPDNIVHEEVLHGDELIEHGEDQLDQLDDNEELFEEISGKIMQMEDGRYYVATDVNTADVDFETISKIEVIVNEDGSETVIFEAEPVPLDEQEDGVPKDVKDNIRGRGNHHIDSQLELGAIATADDDENGLYMNYDDADLKYGRRNRKHGSSVCPECNQSFVNTARLERHLSVHQIFGSFLCQLCGKTYKYEYNLFYHWRKTCRDLIELLSEDERKSIDVNQLREMVEDLAAKKSSYGGNLELGISAAPLYRNINPDSLEDSHRASSKRHVTCQACSVNILAAHMPKHLKVHNGSSHADLPSVGGGYFCDLCGLIFRQKSNLYKHWRTNCSEIMANLPDEADLTLDDDSLQQMVEDILKKSAVSNVEDKMPKTDTEKARLLDSLTADLNIDMSGIIENEETEDETQNSNIFDQKWIENHGIIFADDLPEGSPFLEMARGGGNQFVHPNSKYSQHGEVLQCPECFKPFMSVARLEKHIAGYHASSGTHHCPLCGNRFKYSYNLMYHFRRSCPYTKAFIERDVREQIDSTSLRKLVRNLSVQQPALPANFSSRLNSIMQNDAYVHKQMMSGDTDGKLPVTKIPPHNVQPPRQGLPHGYRCPHCNIIFYGTTAIKLHMKMCHQEEFEVKSTDEIIQEEIVTEMPHDALSGSDMPPKLELEDHKPITRHRIYDEQGNDITNTPEVQALIESGEIQFNDGEEIILVDQESAAEHLDYFEPDPIEQKAETSRQRQASRNAAADVSLNESGGPTRRSNRLSRTYNKDQDIEEEGDEAMEVDEIEQVNEAESSRRSGRQKKNDASPAPPTPSTSRRQARTSESNEVSSSPRRSLRSKR